MAPNAVRRSIHRSVADLLAHHFGRARRNDVMVDLAKPTSDTREVRVTSKEIHEVLASCDVEFRDFAALAMLLAVDRDPLLQITRRHFREDLGTLDILDTKSAEPPLTRSEHPRRDSSATREWSRFLCCGSRTSDTCCQPLGTRSASLRRTSRRSWGGPGAATWPSDKPLRGSSGSGRTWTVRWPSSAWIGCTCRRRAGDDDHRVT
jgi:hypothetical protein